jgi:hypothetical protein
VGTVHRHPHIWIIVGLFYPRHHLNGCLPENLLPFRSLADDPGSGLAGILTFAFVHIESALNLFERFVQILIAGHKTPITGFANAAQWKPNSNQPEGSLGHV